MSTATMAKKKPNTPLRAPQLRVLQCLAREGRPLTRKEIAELAPTDQDGLTTHLGSSDPEVRAKNDQRRWPSLLSLGLVRAEEGEQGTVYSLTPKGKAALKKLAKDAPAGDTTEPEGQ